MSLAEEKIRKSFHDKIVQAIELEGVLVQSRGPDLEAVVPWGRISSVLDTKAVQALLIASYG